MCIRDRYTLFVLAPNKNSAALANKITELSVRLNVTEEQNRLLREENQRLQQIELDHQKLKSEHQQTVERKVLLEEEVRWLKAQYYGRSTQSSDAAEQNPGQQMLFNEAEVLAAIEAADEAHRERTTKIDAHERDVYKRQRLISSTCSTSCLRASFATASLAVRRLERPSTS